MEPASTASTATAVIAPTATLPIAPTMLNLTDWRGPVPSQVSNLGSHMPGGVAVSRSDPQLLQGNPPRETHPKRHPKNINSGSMVSVVIPSTPSAPAASYPRTRSQSRRPQGDDNRCSSNDVSPGESSCSSNRNSDSSSSPPSSPSGSCIYKDSLIRDACPVCKKAGELLKIKGQGFVWCDKHSKQIPVLRSSGNKGSDVLRSRDDQKILKNCELKPKAPLVTTIATQTSSGKRLKGHDDRKTSKKRVFSPVESKRKRRHVTPDEDSLSESI